MRHTYDLHHRLTRCTASAPPPFRHLLTESPASLAASSVAANASTPGDDVDVDLDTDMDVDMDIQIDDSGNTPPGTDGVRVERRAWSSVPKVAAPPAPARPLRDRRRSYRHGVSLPVELHLHGTPASERHAATTRMLSFGGAFVESRVRPAFASRVSLVFSVPGHELNIQASGIVRWSDERGFGVQFDGLRAQAVWALGKYFARL